MRSSSSTSLSHLRREEEEEEEGAGGGGGEIEKPFQECRVCYHSLWDFPILKVVMFIPPWRSKSLWLSCIFRRQAPGEGGEGEGGIARRGERGGGCKTGVDMD